MRSPQFAVVVPVYNVERYLDDFLGSLERQTLGVESLEIILVNDGSTDGSLERCRKFASNWPEQVTVLDKPNGGQASARNLGLDHAQAEWVTFPDSDDVLCDDYFALISDFIAANQESGVTLVAGHPIIWHERTGVKRDSHVLSFRFKEGDSLSDLRTRPEYVQPHVTSGFFRNEIIQRSGLRFDERLRTRFEDGSFLVRYFLEAEVPLLGLVKDAEYYYRQRADGSSAIQTNTIRSQTYTDVPRFGYYEVLTQSAARNGAAAELWIQLFVLYDLCWLLRNDNQSKVPSRSLDEQTLAEFHVWVQRVMTLIDPFAVYAFDLLDIPRWFRDALVHGYDGNDFVSEPFLSPPDTHLGIMPIRYRFTGEQPDERIFIHGSQVEPRHQKTRELRLLGRVMVRERTLWVPTHPEIRVLLNDHLQLVQTRDRRVRVVHNRTLRFHEALQRMENPGPTLFQVRPGSVLRRAASDIRRWLRGAPKYLRKRKLKDVGWALIIRLPWVRRKYEGAWMLIDKDTEANDSAEQLYRWLREHRPEVRCFFVVSKTSSDWDRLKVDGFRLIGYRTWRWKPLVLLAGHVISSHIDGYISHPLKVKRYGTPPWRISFLQHGIIKGDLSPWLNSKDAALVVASTDAEYDYLTGESPYKVGTKEVRLTGLPRHDALLAKNATIPDEQKNLIVLAPTWRKYLVGQMNGKTARRTLNQDFLSSEFATQWQQLLHSDGLRGFAQEHGLEIVFLPHPNIQPYLGVLEVPEYVRVARYADTDVQQIVCRASVMVTDYSSMAFNLAYLYRPVCYFQFDRAQYEAGHTEGKGYFAYERDGFGPVSEQPAGIVEALQRLWNEPAYRERYVSRARETFPVRDGRNSERVFRAISELDQRLSLEEASQPAQRESWAMLIDTGGATGSD